MDHHSERPATPRDVNDVTFCRSSHSRPTPSATLLHPIMTTTRPRVFLDINIGQTPAGRLTIELFVDKAPRTCEK